METVKFKTTPLNSTERKVNDEDISAKKEIKEAEKKNGRTWWTFKHPMFCPFHVLLKKKDQVKKILSYIKLNIAF